MWAAKQGSSHSMSLHISYCVSIRWSRCSIKLTTLWNGNTWLKHNMSTHKNVTATSRCQNHKIKKKNTSLLTKRNQGSLENGWFQIWCKERIKWGAPEWLTQLSVWLWLRSWSHSLWVWAPRRGLCWQLGAWSLLWILCLPLSLPLPHLCSVSLTLRNKIGRASCRERVCLYV